MKSEYIIKMENVEKFYERFHALKEINLEIKKGDFVSIMGPSGSGKSTLMNLIGCLDIPTYGRILLDGDDITKLTGNELAQIRGKKIGFVFQSFNLYPSLTIKENIELPLKIHEMKTEGIAVEILKKVGLENKLNKFPSQLSGGERQRVAIARALATDPEMILADEPTGNLDSKTGKIIIDLLKELNKKGITIVIITHDHEVAEQTKKIIEIRDGQIIKG